MSKWTVIFDDGQIGKDGHFYGNLDLSWLPTSIRAVQSLDGVTCTIEHGNRATETNTHNDEDVATSSLSWWSNVSTTWQAAYDAEQVEIAASEATPE
jgi:hypothetical protein